MTPFPALDSEASVRPCRSSQPGTGGWWAVAALLWALPSVTIVTVVRLWHDIPWGDNLTLFVDNRMADGLTFERLFRFHNEHLIVPTKLAVYADYWLWHGANVLPAVMATAGTLGIIGIYGWMFLRWHGRLPPAQAACATGLLAVILLNGRLAWTLTCPILLQHVSVNLLASGTLAAYATLATAGAGQRRREWTWPVFLVGGLVAATASASGVLIMPAAVAATAVLVAMSPAFRALRWRTPLGVATLMGTGLLATYFLAHATGGPTHSAGRTADPQKAVRFALYFLGGAFLRDSEWPIAIHPDGLVLHVVVLGFWAACVWVVAEMWRRRDSLGGFELFHAAMLAFVIVTALAGGLFRSQLGDLEALNKKYASTALLAWASVASLVMHYRCAGLFGDGFVKPLRALAFAAIVVSMILPGDLLEFRAWDVWRRQLREAIVAFAAGVHNEPLLKRFFPSDRLAHDMVQEIRGDSAYAFRSLPEVGGSLEARYSLVLDRPQSAVVEAVSHPAANDDRAGRVAVGRMSAVVGESLPNMVVADDAGRMVGFGNASRVGLDGARLLQTEWFAAYHVEPGQRVFLYAIDRGCAVLVGELSEAGEDRASTAALTDERRGTRVPRVPDHSDYGLEFINDVEGPLFKPPTTVGISADVRFVGWAVDRSGGAPATAVEIVIDGHRYRARNGLPRPDVAEYLHDPRFVSSGFRFTMPAAQIGSGTHAVCLRMFLADGDSYLESPTVSLVVE